MSVHAPYGLLDFDGPPPAPRRLGSLQLDPVGVYPGSLGNYGGLVKNVPVMTLELKNARAVPAQRTGRDVERPAALDQRADDQPRRAGERAAQPGAGHEDDRRAAQDGLSFRNSGFSPPGSEGFASSAGAAQNPRHGAQTTPKRIPLMNAPSPSLLVAGIAVRVGLRRPGPAAHAAPACGKKRSAIKTDDAQANAAMAQMKEKPGQHAARAARDAIEKMMAGNGMGTAPWRTGRSIQRVHHPGA